MRVILAAIDGRNTASSVLDAAQAMSTIFDASPRAVHVRSPEAPNGDSTVLAGRHDIPVVVLTGDPVAEIVHAAAHTDVALVVVGARDVPAGPRPAGHIALGIVERTAKPVLVVPPSSVSTRTLAIRRALVPLEGTTESAEAVADCMCLLAEAGVELVGVHVFDEDVPRFWDEPAHAADAYTDEFSARWCRQPGVGIRLRRGSAPATMIEVAEAEDVDLIALAWSQDMAPGHAEMIRAALGGASVPVLLVPVPGRSGPQDPVADTIRP